MAFSKGQRVRTTVDAPSALVAHRHGRRVSTLTVTEPADTKED